MNKIAIGVTLSVVFLAAVVIIISEAEKQRRNKKLSEKARNLAADVFKNF